MGYRYTLTSKWEDKWYRKLSKEEKLIFEYLRDRCDNAGFYEIDMEIILVHTNLTEKEILGAIEGLKRSYLRVEDTLWLKNFLRHQKNLPLNPKNNAHKQIINIIQGKLNLFPQIPKILGAVKGLFSPPGNGRGNGKESLSLSLKDSIVCNDEWRKDFEIYKARVDTAFNEILADEKEMEKQQSFYPNVNIKLSLEKEIHNFWGQEAGWKHKKKSRAKEIDMKSTLINNLDKHKVYKPDDEKNYGIVG